MWDNIALGAADTRVWRADEHGRIKSVGTTSKLTHAPDGSWWVNGLVESFVEHFVLPEFDGSQASLKRTVDRWQTVVGPLSPGTQHQFEVGGVDHLSYGEDGKPRVQCFMPADGELREATRRGVFFHGPYGSTPEDLAPALQRFKEDLERVPHVDRVTAVRAVAQLFATVSADWGGPRGPVSNDVEIVVLEPGGATRKLDPTSATALAAAPAKTVEAALQPLVSSYLSFLPGGWNRYLDFVGSGNDPFIKHEKFVLEHDGDAMFSGQVDIDAAQVQQTVQDFHILLRDPDVAHGMTSLVETDVLGALGFANSLTGGLNIHGFQEGTATPALLLQGNMGGTPQASVAAVVVEGWKKSGTTRTKLTGDEAIFIARAGTVGSDARFTVTPDWVGIGGDDPTDFPNALGLLRIFHDSSLDGTVQGFRSHFEVLPKGGGGDITGTKYGGELRCDNAMTNGADGVDVMIGVKGSAYLTDAGHVNTAMHGVAAQVGRTSGAGTAPLGTGVHVEAPVGAAAFTDLVGLEIEDQTGATNNWAIRTGSGLVRLEDNVGIGKDGIAIHRDGGLLRWHDAEARGRDRLWGRDV
jgi:hypothetical protein